MTPENKFSTITPMARPIRRAPTTFTGNEHHLITLEDARRITENYRNAVPQDSILGGYFSQRIFSKLLGQHTCVGIRIYLASKDEGTPTFVLAGANATGNDLYEGILGAEPIMGPPWPNQQSSELNSSLTKIAENPSGSACVFSGNENHLTTLAEATQLTRNFRESTMNATGKGGFFGRNIFDRILAQSDCVGIRVYYARHDNGGPTFVLAGVDEVGRDLSRGILGEYVMWCPPFCAPRNPLNH